ncbi:MAG: hypothetical protein QM783_19130 [Phycisphaerales bacterium]
MPLWLEQFVNDKPWVIWLPLIACVVGVAALWGWQGRRGKGDIKDDRQRAVRVGWLGGLATVVAVLAVVAFAGYQIDLWGDVWEFVNEQPTLVSWWVAAIGVVVALWGIAVHAWRGEARLSRQCRRCGYDMTGVPGVMMCPECGRMAKNERQLRPRNVRRGAMWLGGLIVFASWTTPSIIAAFRWGPAAALPTRTLVWWPTVSSSPPQGVFKEITRRMEGEPEKIATLLAARRAQLIQCELKAPAELQADYVKLIETSVIKPEEIWEALNVARAEMASPDKARRSAGVALWAQLSGPDELSPEVYLQLLRDADPQVARHVSIFDPVNTHSALSMVLGNGDPEKVDLSDLRLILRQGHSHNIGTKVAAKLEPFRHHADVEIAARATVIVFVDRSATEQVDDELVREVVNAVEYLGSKPNSPGSSLPYLYARAGSLAKLEALVDDPDPSMRSLVCRQYGEWVRSSHPLTVERQLTRWASMLKRLETRLAIETDAAVKAEIAQTIEIINSKVNGRQRLLADE